MALTDSGTVLEKELVAVTEDGDHDRFAHYFKKADLDLAWLDGEKITALCGKKDLPTRDFMKYPVCDTCKDLYAQYPE